MYTHSMTEGAPWKHIIKFTLTSTKIVKREIKCYNFKLKFDKSCGIINNNLKRNN